MTAALTARPGRNQTPPPTVGRTFGSPENSPQWVLVLAPTRTRTRNTEGVLLSTIVPGGFAFPRTRRQQRANKTIAYWAGRLKNAETGREALNQMWSWHLGALTQLEKRHPAAAEAACYHLARQLADFTVKLPGAEIPFRAGLTEDEERRLFDPWGRRGDIR